MTTLGERLRRARKAAGLTGEELAERLNVTRAYISAIENERRSNPSLDFITKASFVLGVTCSYLLGMYLPGAGEVGFYLHAKGLLTREDYERQCLAMSRLCEREGFDPIAFCVALGLPFGDTPPANRIDEVET